MFEIIDSDISIDSLLKVKEYSNETMGRILHADVVLIPKRIDVNGEQRLLFDSDTYSFYKYVKVKNPTLKLELLENRGEEQSQSLHSHDIWLPFLYIPSVIAFDIIKSLLIEYVIDRIKGIDKDSESIIHFEMIVENDDKKKMIKYKGPAKHWLKACKEMDINKLWSE